MGFPRIRLVEQTEQKFRRIRGCLKEKQNKTRQERLKSALYLRLKQNRRGTLWRQKKIKKKSHSAEKTERGTIYTHLVL